MAMHSPRWSKACGECCPGGHCDPRAGVCIHRLGRTGPRCDNLTFFDAPGPFGEASLQRLTGRRLPTGAGQIWCYTAKDTMSNVRSMARAWAKAADKNPRRAACFGCPRAGANSSARGAERHCCAGRGTCVNGWCACKNSSFGIDCREGPDASATWPTPNHGLRIYVYGMPPELSFTFGRSVHKSYLAENAFMDRLLADKSIRTLDPEAADLYLVPMLSVHYGHASNQYCHRARIEMAMLWLKAHHPYWDRSGGRDHVFFIAGDKGACGLDVVGSQPILLTHFGLLSPYSVMRSAANGTPPPYTNTTATEIERPLRNGKWCYSPHKDIVVPPYDQTSPQPTAINSTLRRHTLVHSGGIWAWRNLGPVGVTTWYSMGMRQRLFIRWGGEDGERHGIRILNHSMPPSLLKTSRFCLAPHGDGFGMRLSAAILAGCLPLIAQPFVEQPFERLLDFPTFSRRLGLDVEQLPQLLELDEAQEATMRDSLRLAQQAFSWRPSGRAYEYVISALCQRAIELRGRLKASPYAKCSIPAQGVPNWFPTQLVQAIQRLQAERREAMARGTPGPAL